MTLRHKISWQVGGMLVGLVLMSGASLWGIDAVNQDHGVALDGYRRLRQTYAAGTHLATAARLLQWPHPRAVEAARDEVRAAASEVGPLVASGPSQQGDSSAAKLKASLDAIDLDLSLLENAPGGLPPADGVAEQRLAVVAQVGVIGEMSDGIRQATEAAQRAADAKRHATVGLLAGLGSAVVLAGVLLGVAHYRGVMGPIRRLTAGVHRVTAGQFKGRVDDRGKDELASLARDFNRMAAELDEFYRDLERKVAEKSRELVRSERLASVGYLAAGVAHEINNPLGIMLGYAEHALAELAKSNGDPPRPDVLADVGRSLAVVCDEAMRCKAITNRLLSLARGGDEIRGPVSLLAVADEVASIVGGLRAHRDKRVVVRSDAGGAVPTVHAVEAEMKQVVLNLTVNALEAVTSGTGEVRLDVRRAGGDDAGAGRLVELVVTDNGRGMAAETVERVFEPFFTESRGGREDGPRGTGLGLSITHAIVQGHGGTLTAHSDGPGKGSRFVVRLPASGPLSPSVPGGGEG